MHGGDTVGGNGPGSNREDTSCVIEKSSLCDNDLCDLCELCRRIFDI